nr:MAG TPA: hypothetical protein [Caudoviricetes sp.]
MLKALLQQLLLAFRGSHKSVPFYRSTIYQTGQFTSSVSNQTFLTYTAPSDGYLVLQVAQDTSVEYVMLTMRRETLDIAQAYNGGWGWPVVTSPVKKGEEYTFLYKITGGNPAQLSYHLNFFSYLN